MHNLIQQWCMTHSDTSTHKFLGTAVACGVLNNIDSLPAWSPKHTPLCHTPRPLRSGTNPTDSASLHHCCLSSLIVKAKKKMETKLKSLLMVSQTWSSGRETCVWVQTAKRSLLSFKHTVFMP